MRFPTRFPAELRVRSERLAVTVRDISEAGAMIEGSGLPEAGRHALFSAHEVEVEVKVVWQEDATAGIEFLQRVDPLAVVRHNVPEMIRTRRAREPRE